MTDKTKQNITKWVGIILTTVTLLAGHFHYTGRLNQIEEAANVVCEAVKISVD